MSDQAAFEIVGGGGAPVPTASWPVGGATVYSLQPALNWYTSGGSATSFEVELINTTASETFDGTADFTTTDRTVDLSAEAVTLASGADYEWRIRSSDATTTSDWSASALFSTVAVASVTAPTPSYPTGGALLYSTDARLSWYLGTAATGLSYTVTLTPDGGTPVTYPATTALVLDVTGLTPGADYTWSVSASDGSTSAASVDATFSVFQAVAASAGTAVASWPVVSGGPAPVVRTRKPTLSWWVDGSRASLSGFQVEWSTDATFATVERSRRVRDANAASFEVPQALDWATTYYWRVGAIEQGESAPNAWSEGTFATLGADGSLVPVASVPDRRSDDLHRRRDAVVVRLGRSASGARLHGRVRHLVRLHRSYNAQHRRFAAGRASPGRGADVFLACQGAAQRRQRDGVVVARGELHDEERRRGSGRAPRR